MVLVPMWMVDEGNAIFIEHAGYEVRVPLYLNRISSLEALRDIQAAIISKHQSAFAAIDMRETAYQANARQREAEIKRLRNQLRLRTYLGALGLIVLVAL